MSGLRAAAQQALEALEGALETIKSDWHLIDNDPTLLPRTSKVVGSAIAKAEGQA